jgi:hypothetical protein
VSEWRTVHGGGLLHPLPIAAICVLLLNDHMLKQSWPSPVTGILSDFAGLTFFPLFVQAAWELANPSRRPGSRRVLAVACFVTGAAFASAKLTDLGTFGYTNGLGAMQSVLTFAMGEGWLLHGVAFRADPTDLLALGMLPLAYAIGAGRATSP